MKTRHLLAAAFLLATNAARAADPSADAQLIQRGEYLSRAGDCIACHTATGGKPYAGGLGIASPLGTIYSTNITPDKKTGIGTYTLEDFDRALRQGIAKDGHSLYPAMPYTSFARVSPDDVKALYAYFMHGVAPVDQPNKANGITWPLSMRWPLGVWRKMFAPTPVDTPAPAPADSGDAAMLRGKYLVEGLGHCSACHTPRGVALQEKATSAADGADFLSGGVVDGWLAGNLRGDTADGLGTWSKADLVAFLKSGRNTHSAAFGGMSDVVEQSTQYLSDSDLNAIASYLKSLPPKNAAATRPMAYNDTAGEALLGGHAASIPGAMDFLNNCAACHRATGKGQTEVFPALAQNPAVNAADPQSLIHIILVGARVPSTNAAPTSYTMPAFDWRLTDKEVADIATFVRSSWGNNAPAVSADQVAKVRKQVGAAAAPSR